MKCIYLASLLLLSCTTVSAQVYSFTPTIRFSSTYFSFRKSISLVSDIDTLCKVGKLVVDIDNKTITNPESIETPLALYAIKSVSYDEANRMYNLEVADPMKMTKFLLFHVKLNRKDEIVYLKKVLRYKGSDFKGDTIFSTFTKDLRAVEFSVNSSRLKENLMLSADTAENAKQMNEVYDAAFVNQNTRVEMRDGYFSWTEGKGSAMKYHSYRVDEARFKNEPGKTEGFEFVCNVSNSVFYSIAKVNTRRSMAPSQSGWREVILIAKFEDGIRTAFSIIESY